ncbi:hypothetical protein LOTGIDRAFT_174636 [Lottia gigantea]|uniref:Transcriptional regulatory protein n=1 Tax=Lottia gigantea TaxID=225164 RepID=V4AJ25_LOTGI|nr:hypothetical protein LOTGIDRAFT_174636 [Lottia gigantea]ESO97067.1 hypothetical protein LOTGIDRAFT_174636 [Lottia gigantea]
MVISSNNFERFQSEKIQRKNDSALYFHVFACANLKFTQIRKLHASTKYLAGHSQWANRRVGKQIQDKKKANVREGLMKNVVSVIKQTGETDPRYNPKLQKLFDQAKLKDVPKSTLDNVIKRISSKSFEVTTVEIALPGNMFIIYEISSTNMALTVNQMKNVCKQVGGFVEKGCCSRIFEEKGFVDVGIGVNEKADVEQYVDIAIEAGAEDVVLEENDNERYIRFMCEAANLYQVKGKLEKLGLNVINLFNEYLPHQLVNLEENHKKNLKAFQMKLDNNLISPCIERKFTNFIDENEE